jgi:hypothetical protein
LHNKYANQFIHKMSSESDISLTPSPKQRTQSQKASLARIVKAQVTLLISNLNNDNFTRKSTEINTVSYLLIQFYLTLSY